MSLSYVKRVVAAVFVLPSEHESLEARFGPARRHMSNCTMCVRECVSRCGSRPELSGKLFCLFPIDVAEMECRQN